LESTGGLENELTLELEDLVTGKTCAGHQDDERNVLGLGGHHRRDQTALAVTNEADLLGVDVGSRLQIGHAGQDILGEVGSCRLRGASRRAADTAVIDSQDGDPLARQMVGQDEEWLMA
jgi:hypothetical protein